MSTDFVTWVSQGGGFAYNYTVKSNGTIIMTGGTNSITYWSRSGLGDAAGNQVVKIKYLGAQSDMQASVNT